MYRSLDSSLRWNDDKTHSDPIVIPACLLQAGLEQAAEEGGPGGEAMAGFAGWRVRLICLLLFPLTQEWIM